MIVEKPAAAGKLVGIFLVFKYSSLNKVHCNVPDDNMKNSGFFFDFISKLFDFMDKI